MNTTYSRLALVDVCLDIFDLRNGKNQGELVALLSQDLADIAVTVVVTDRIESEFG